eukprot:jgi/Ulvmu1/1559/UM110_0022.1
MDLWIVFLRLCSLLLVLLAAWPCQGVAGAPHPGEAGASGEKDAGRSFSGSSGRTSGLRMPASLFSWPTPLNCSRIPRLHSDAWLSYLLQPDRPDFAIGHDSRYHDVAGHSHDVSRSIVATIDHHLQYTRLQPRFSAREQRCGKSMEEQLPVVLQAAVSGLPPRLPVRRVTGETDATNELARLADCEQPARIVLLVDQVLRFNAGQPSTSVLWVMSVVANSLSTLAAMQTDMQSAVVYSEVIVRKAVRWNVPLSALALKVMRNEVVVPLLAAPVALPARARRCPAWRAHLHAVTMLTYWHGYDVMVAFAAELAVEAAGDVLGAPAAVPGAREAIATATPLYRVAHVVTDVLEWWRQPQARGVLAAVPEADLWAAFVLRAQGDSSWEAQASPVLVKLMSGDLPNLRRPTPVELRPGDVTAFVQGLKLALVRAGCLQAPSGIPESAVVRALTISPGCPSLRRFMRSPEGRAAYVRPHASEPGFTGVAVRGLARCALTVNILRDTALLWLDGAVSRSSAAWGALVQLPLAPPPQHPQTLFEWMASTDPWTVFGTSVAALLAVLRVVVRLTSAFSTAATLSAPPSAMTPPPTVTAAPEAPPAPASSTRKSAKRGAKGRHKAARAIKAAPGPPRTPDPKPTAPAAAEAPCSPPEPLSSPAPARPPVFDPIAQRFCHLDGAGRSAKFTPQPLAEVPATAHTVAHLRTAMLPARLGDLRPPLAAAICAALPSLLYMPASALVRCAAHAAKAASAPPSPAAKTEPATKLASSDSPSAAGDYIPSSGVPCHPEPPQTVALLDGESCSSPGTDAATDAAADGMLPCDLSAKLQVYRKEECGQVPELFLCPISREVMENPVLASDGHVYERAQIEAWLKAHQTSPMTNMAMRPEVRPVLSLRSEIQAFKQRFPHIV